MPPKRGPLHHIFENLDEKNTDEHTHLSAFRRPGTLTFSPSSALTSLSRSLPTCFAYLAAATFGPEPTRSGSWYNSVSGETGFWPTGAKLAGSVRSSSATVLTTRRRRGGGRGWRLRIGVSFRSEVLEWREGALVPGEEGEGGSDSARLRRRMFGLSSAEESSSSEGAQNSAP